VDEDALESNVLTKGVSHRFLLQISSELFSEAFFDCLPDVVAPSMHQELRSVVCEEALFGHLRMSPPG
jgi:hypothetical protein